MEQEIEIVKGNQSGNLTERIKSVLKAEQLTLLQEEVEEMYIHDVIYNYIGELVISLRKNRFEPIINYNPLAELKR